MSKPKVSPIQYRQIVLEGRPEGRRMAAALSSPEPVERVFGNEILRHDADSVDMNRAQNGLPLLVNHDRNALPIGRVEGIRIGNDQRLRGDLVFSEATESARDAFALVEDGTLSDVSIGYRVMDWEKGDEPGSVNVTRWQPFEVSMVAVPADGNVGIGRTLDIPEKGDRTVTDKTPEVAPASILDKARERSSAGYQAGIESERGRLNDIAQAASLLARGAPHLEADIRSLEEVAREDAAISADKFRSLAFELIGSGTPSDGEAPATRPAFHAPTSVHRGLIMPGEDSRDKLRAGMELALYERCGGKHITAEDMRGNQFRGWSLIDFADTCLRDQGIDTRGLSREQIAKQVIRQSNRAIEAGAATGGASSDYASVTSNIATKFAFEGFSEAEVTWNQWCSTGSSPDFKNFEIPRLSAFGSLPVVAENAQYQGQQMVDANETGALVKHGATLALTWEATVNDDLSMFQRNAFRMGEAAARTVDEQVYATLTLNPGVGVMGPVMGDTNQLFDSTNHSNTGTAALNLAGIIATRVAMGRQTDDNSVLLGVRLAHILVPLELQDTAEDLASSEWLVDAGGQAQRVNTVRSTFTVVATPRLTDVTDWFGLARRGSTMEVVFLNGQQAPTLEQEMGWSYDTLNWKVRHVFDVLPVDWRGFVWNEVAG